MEDKPISLEGRPLMIDSAEVVVPTVVDIVMIDHGPNLIECIKLLRLVSQDLGSAFTLKEAKDNTKPMSVVFYDVPYWKAKEIREKFQEISTKIKFMLVDWS